MSLPESPAGLTNAPFPADPAPPDDLPPVDPRLLALRAALAGIMTVAGEYHGRQPNQGRLYIFRGRLTQPPQRAFALLKERFHPLDFRPMLLNEHGEDAVVAIEGLDAARQVRTRPWLHLVLLLLTVLTTTAMGAALTGIPSGDIVRAIQAQRWHIIWPALRDGLPFSLTLLGILGVHEMGHYIAARRHGIQVTLPFFIPLPLPNSLGTMGAVIFIKSPLHNRRALFDVGLAGPLAGLLIALPLYLIGLGMPQTVGLPLSWIEMGITRVSNPPLLAALAGWVYPEITNLDRVVLYGHPMALAAWFGVLLTGLNLLPLGQFDGGHVAYALLGRRAWPLAYATFALLIVMGVMGAWIAWLIWALIGFFTGLRHPPPQDDLTPLGWWRVALGVLTAILFALIIVPVPFYTG